jgi:hypothetical protein
MSAADDGPPSDPIAAASTRSAKNADPLIGATLPNDVQVRQVLSDKGGMGTVYLAWDARLHREVVVKVMRPYIGPADLVGDVEARFLQECQTVARLEDPRTVKIFSYGRTDDGRMYMVTERLRGQGLDELLAEKGRLGPDETVSILIDVCHSLEEAHAAGIVHRDIKPANLFLQQIKGGGRMTRVLDFGIAKVGASSGIERRARTQMGVSMGTVEYMSPEQARADPVEAPSDLYSLGVVAYECLTGALPFSGSTELVLMAHNETPPPRFAERGVQLPAAWAELETLVMQLLAKAPSARPSSARDLRRRLEGLGRATATEPAPSPPPRPPARTRVPETRPGAGSNAGPESKGGGPEGWGAGLGGLALLGLVGLGLLLRPQLIGSGPGVPEGLVPVPEAYATHFEAHRAGRLQAFRDAMRRGVAETGDPAFAFNWGVVGLAEGRCAEALEAVERFDKLCRRCGLADRGRALAEQVDRRCRAAVSWDIQPRKARVEIDGVAVPELPDRLGPGRHEIRARAPGHRTREQVLQLEPGQTARVELHLPASTRRRDAPSAPEPLRVSRRVSRIDPDAPNHAAALRRLEGVVRRCFRAHLGRVDRARLSVSFQGGKLRSVVPVRGTPNGSKWAGCVERGARPLRLGGNGLGLVTYTLARSGSSSAGGGDR